MSSFSSLKTAIQNAIKANGNQEITGNLLQGILLSIVETLGDSAINTLETGLSNEAATRGNADTELNNLITGVKNNVDNGYVYAGIAIPTTSPVSGKVFYIATKAGTYTNLGGLSVTEGITILKYNGSTWSKEQVIYGDGGVYDVTAQNGGATFASLEALLGSDSLSTLIPTAVRKGGMSIKFVQTSDHKYARFNLLANAFTTDTTQWQGIDEEPVLGSSGIVESDGLFKGLNIYNFNNLYNNNLIYAVGSNKNFVINAASPHNLVQITDASQGINRCTIPLRIPNGFDYLYYKELYSGGTALKIGFYVTSTTSGENNSETYILQNSKILNAEGLVPVGEYYNRGFRYVIIELCRKVNDESVLENIVLGWTKLSSIKNIVEQNVLDISYAKGFIDAFTNEFTIEEVFDENTVRTGKVINSASPYEILNYTSQSVVLTGFIEIPSNCEYIIYKGIYGENVCLARLSVSASDTGNAKVLELINNGNYGIIPKSKFNGYNYITFTVSRILIPTATADLSDVSIQTATKDESFVTPEETLNYPSVTPRRPCIVFQMDGAWNLFANVNAYRELLSTYGVNKSSFLILSSLMSQYGNSVLNMYRDGDEIAVHGQGQSGDYNDILKAYLQTFATYGIKNLFGYVELSSNISAAQLLIARKYFGWIVKNGGDYALLGDDYLLAVNSLSDKPYELKRLSIEMRHTAHGDSTNITTAIDHVKAAIDKTIQDNGVLVLYGHSYNQVSGTDYTVYNDVLEPILSYLQVRLNKGICVTGRTIDVLNYYYTKRFDE